MNLPDTIDYDTLAATLRQLLPGMDLMLVSNILIQPQHLTVELWNGRHSEQHQIPIRHKQGAFTEGSGQ